MKTRIALTLGLIIGAPFLDNSLLHPAETIVKNNVAVSTLNGGDAAFVTQQAVHSASSFGHILFYVAFLTILFAIWFAPVNKWINKTNS